MSYVKELENQAKDSFEERDYEKLNKISLTIIDSFPSNPAGYYYQGLCNMRDSHFKEAVDYFTSVIDLDEGYSDCYFSRGIAWKRLEVIHEALNDFKESVRINPELAKAYFEIGCIYSSYDFELYNQAIEELGQAILYAKGEVPLSKYYNKMGMCYYLLQRFEDAVSCYKKSSKINGGDPYTYRMLADNYEELGDYQNALSAIRRAIELGENHSDYLVKRYEKELENVIVDAKEGDFIISELSEEQVKEKIRNFTAQNLKSEDLILEKNILEARRNVILNRCFRFNSINDYVESEHEPTMPNSFARMHEAWVRYYFIIEVRDKLAIESLKEQLLRRIGNDDFIWHDFIFISVEKRDTNVFQLEITKRFVSNEIVPDISLANNYRNTIKEFLRSSLENLPIGESKYKDSTKYFF